MDAGAAALPRQRLRLHQQPDEPRDLTGYSGIMTSPFFMQPTGVQNPRKVDMGVNISF